MSHVESGVPGFEFSLQIVPVQVAPRELTPSSSAAMPAAASRGTSRRRVLIPTTLGGEGERVDGRSDRHRAPVPNRMTRPRREDHGAVVNVQPTGSSSRTPELDAMLVVSVAV